MPGRYRQLRMRDPDVFLLLPATSLAHRHARILRTFPVDLFTFCFTYPDLHHGLLEVSPSCVDKSNKLVGSERNRGHMFNLQSGYRLVPAQTAEPATNH